MRAVSAGGQHTLCITEAGELYAMGQGKHGQLGLGDTVSRWRPQKVAALAGKPVRIASAGHEHSAILTEAGEVYTMGEGSRGQLGHAELGYTTPDSYTGAHMATPPRPSHPSPRPLLHFQHVPKLVEALRRRGGDAGEGAQGGRAPKGSRGWDCGEGGARQVAEGGREAPARRAA